MNEQATATKPARTWSMWERGEEAPPFQMQARDIAIIREVFQHRFLTVSHVYAILGGSRDRLSLRCRYLWRHGYLERPKALRPTRILTEEIVYALGKKGAQFLEHLEPSLKIAELDWTETPKKQTGWPYIDHQLGIATFMVCMRKAAEARGFTFRWDGHFNRHKYRLAVPGSSGRVLPDAYFTLEVPGKGIAHHFLEVDRSSVSLNRMRQRYAHYFQYWKTNMNRPGRPFKHFRVLTVTHDADYVHSLRRAAQTIGRSKDYPATWKALMFAPAGSFSLDLPESIFFPIWLYADDDKPVSLV